MGIRAAMAAALATVGFCALSGCGDPGTVHIARWPSGKVKETWIEKGPAGSPTVREGTFKSFHPGGEPESEVEYRGGRRNGPAVLRLADGRMAFRGEYRDDFLVREERWDSAGNPTVDREYAVREARVKALGPAGDSLEVLETCAYAEEAGRPERHGLCRMEYPAGGPLSTRYYHHGRLHGPVKAWHPDGKPWMEGAYHRGRPAGPWKTLSPEGRPVWSASFVRGEPDGAWQEWYPDGKPKSRAGYREGRPHGTYQEWYPGGTPRLKGTRRAGRRHGTETAWYPDGTRLYEAAYADGRLDGPFTQWYPDGRPRLECGFVRGRRHGPSRSWHRGGALMELATWREGSLHGTFKSFAADGRLLVTKEYRGGEVAFDSKARELIELLGAEDVRVPVGAFGLYWGMTPGEARGALTVLQATGVRQEAGALAARAVLFGGGRPRSARLRLRFNDQGELWEIRAEISPKAGEDAFALCERLEAEMGAELGRPEMRKADGGNDWRMTRRREWGRFSLTAGAEVPVRHDLPVVTAEASGSSGGSLRFTLGNNLFREYVNPANASVTPPEWRDNAFFRGASVASAVRAVTTPRMRSPFPLPEPPDSSNFK